MGRWSAFATELSTSERAVANQATTAELNDQTTKGLSAWLALPVPERCEPPTDAPTVAELEALAGRMDGFILAGTTALESAPDHPLANQARGRLASRQAARLALGDLLAALQGEPYDRHRLGTWTASELFKAGDMAAMLAVVDAIADARWTMGVEDGAP